MLCVLRTCCVAVVDKISNQISKCKSIAIHSRPIGNSNALTANNRPIMKEDGRAAPIPLAPQHQQHQPLVMGHHHQQPHLPHSQINRKSPVTTTTTTAMDVHEAQPPVDNPSYTDSPALHVSVLQFKELEGNKPLSMFKKFAIAVCPNKIPTFQTNASHCARTTSR